MAGFKSATPGQYYEICSIFEAYFFKTAIKYEKRLYQNISFCAGFRNFYTNNFKLAVVLANGALKIGNTDFGAFSSFINSKLQP